MTVAIDLTTPHGHISLAKDAKLAYSTLVDTRSIPLFLRCSPLLTVHTTSRDTVAWFDSILHLDGNHESTSYEHSLGLLASVDQLRDLDASGPHPTDILFFAAQTLTPPQSPGLAPADTASPPLQLHAILLSEDLYPKATTPPASPTASSTALPSLVRPLSPSPSTKHTEPTPPQPSISEANKALLPRLIMASMRLHGQTRPPSATREQEDSYKALYHAVLRGVTFAFRAHMDSTPLSGKLDRVRDVVAALLGLYTGDPLGEDGGGFGTPQLGETPGRALLTPGQARRAVETPVRRKHGEGSAGSPQKRKRGMDL